MAVQTGLEGKPWYFGLGIGAFLGVLVIAGFWYLKVQPMNEEIERQEARIQSLDAELVKGRAAKQKLPQFREQVRTLELELDKLLRILPARRNTQDLIRRMRSLTSQGDFSFNRFTPGSFVDREFYSEWPITIQLTGGYHNLATFFDRIANLSRIMNIENLRINATQGGNDTISASFTAKTFVYKEPDEDAAATPQQ
jgi:Tfp pilus assembly protein PilO